MSVKIEKLEHNMVKLTIEVPALRLDTAIEHVYQKMKNRINVPGFRKGKAPRRMIEKLYGVGIFLEDAANDLIPEAYDEALKEIEETIVSRPDIEVVEIEPGKPFVFTATAALKPEVVLGEYKGLEVEVPSVEVSDADVQAEIDREREKNSRMVDVTDRPVQDGDLIKLDFAGSVDGVPFDGGTAQDYPLTIGSGSFIPGFEEQLIGVSVGTETEVHVTFPENYGSEELAGKDALFVCTVKSIQVKELPEEDDEFAQDVSDCDTMEEYRAQVRGTLEENRRTAAKNAKEEAAVAAAAANAQIDIPDAMVEEQTTRMVENFRRRVEAQGITMEQYMQFTGMDQARLTEQMRPEALKQIRSSLTLEAIAKAEGLEVSDERVDEEVARMAEQYQMEQDKLRELMGEYELDQIRNDLLIQAAVELVAASAIEKAPAADDAPAEEGTQE